MSAPIHLAFSESWVTLPDATVRGLLNDNAFWTGDDAAATAFFGGILKKNYEASGDCSLARRGLLQPSFSCLFRGSNDVAAQGTYTSYLLDNDWITISYGRCATILNT